MRKLLFVVFLVMSVSGLYSLQGKASVNFGVIGGELDSKTAFADGFIYGRVLNFSYETYSGLGLSVSPFAFSLAVADEENSAITFANLNIYYNIFNRRNFIFGPFASLSALKLHDLSFFEYSAGLTFVLRNLGTNEIYGTQNFLSPNYLFFETGYKYNNRGHSYFARLSVDLLVFFYFVASAYSQDYSPEYRPENFRLEGWNFTK